MKTSICGIVLGLGLLGACGGDGDSGDTTDTQDVDDTTAPDASSIQAVTEVTCPGAPDAEVTTQGFAFSPMTQTIAVGAVVRFTPTADHNVVGDGIVVGFGATTCFRFDVADTYDFVCQPHGFQGHLTVE